MRRRHVERVVEDRTALRRHPDPHDPAIVRKAGHMCHLFRTALLDGNGGHAVVDLEVNRGRRRGDVKRHTMRLGRERLQIGADLVANVARRRRAIGADDHAIHLSVLHEVTADIVDDDGMRHPVLPKLPGGESGALIARAGFVDEDMHRDAGRVRRVDRRRRGAPVDGRKPAGVAMSQDVDRASRMALGKVPQKPETVASHRSTQRDILLRHRIGFGVSGRLALRDSQGRQRRPHLIHRPGQIYRRWARRAQKSGRVSEMAVGRVFARRERHAVGRGHADQRGAANMHLPDSPFRVADVSKFEDGAGVRETHLVDDAHGVIV